MKITFSILGRLLGAVLVLAFNPSVTHAAFVGPTMITINGTFTDWTNNVYSITNATPLQYKAASDLDAFWMAMSTANGTSPTSAGNRIQNVYYRLDVGKDPSGGGGQAYWIQMNLGVAPPGFADHILQVFANASGTPAVSLTLFQFITNSSTPYPAVAVFTVKTAQVVAKVSNDSTISGAVVDVNATAAFATNGSGYSIEMKLPIGWFTNATYGGAIKDDGTGPAFVETAVFSATGSKGAVGTPQDKIVDASGNQYYAQQSTATGAATFTANNATGYAFSVGAAANTLTPVVGASDSITLTVNQNNSGTIVTDTTYTGAHNVTISGFTAATNGSYGSFNGVTLTGSPQTISVTFASGVATIPLVLDNAATQNIQFSISDLTVPEANVLAITPIAGAASQLVVTTQPGNGTGGLALSTQPVVTLEDQFGNTVTGTAQNVTVAIQTNAGPGGTLSGTATVAVNTNTGVATFSGLSINKIGTGYTLTATGSTVDTSAGTVVSSPFIVTVGAAAKLAFTTEPGNGTGGSALSTQPVVTVQDAGGNTVTTDTSTVTVAIQINAGGGTLNGTLTKAAVAGVADFSANGLKIDKAGTGYTLNVTDGSLTSATSSGFDITVGPPVANPLTYYRAKNTSIKISITNLIARSTSDPQGDSLGLVAVAGGLLTNNTVIATTTNGSSVYIANPYHGSAYIVLTPTNNLNETFPYVVNDTSYPALTATNLITITVTNAVGQLTGNIYQSGDGGVTTTWAGIPGSSYVVQRSTDLSSWTDLWTTNGPAAGVFSFTDPSPPNPAYYRVRQN